MIFNSIVGLQINEIVTLFFKNLIRCELSEYIGNESLKIVPRLQIRFTYLDLNCAIKIISSNLS